MFIEEYIRNSIYVKERVLADKELLGSIELIVNLIVDCYKNGNKVLTAGNGGSAADAQHIAGELVSKLYLKRPGLPAYALTTNSSVITAISNDYGYENVFARQLEGMGTKGDVFLCLSTSGTSANIITAVKKAKMRGIVTIGFTGGNSCDMDKICDYIIKIPSDDTPQIQEAHIMIGHIICALVEKKLFA